MTSTLKKIGVLLCLSLKIMVFGQIKISDGIFEKQAYFKLSADSLASFSYYEIRDSAALRELAGKKHHPDNFPLIVVKRAVFNPFSDLIQRYEIQVDSLYALDKQNQALDRIQQLKMFEMNKLDILKDNRIENYKHLSEELSRTNESLNKQLNEALDIKTASNKPSIRKQIWAGILGGTAGFSLATIFFVLAR